MDAENRDYTDQNPPLRAGTMMMKVPGVIL